MKKSNIIMWKHFIKALPLTLIFMLLAGAVGAFAAAGTTDSSAAPGSTNSYTLEDIYQRLFDGTAGTQSTFTEPLVAPGTGTMYTLNDIMGVAPALDSANGAISTDVLDTKTFWGLTNGEWGLQTGSIATGSDVSGGDSDKTFNIPNGYYSGNTATCNDTELVASNILASAEILGVTGSIAAGSDVSGADGTKTFSIPDGYYSSNTATCNDTDLNASNIKSGVEILGTTGTMMGGCHCNSGTLSGTRWCDNGDGTVTDLTTCLVWIQNPQTCSNFHSGWEIVMPTALMTSDGDCGISDGSVGGDWWLPTKQQLQGLMTGTEAVSAGTPGIFSNVKAGQYWSSTVVAFTGPPSHGIYVSAVDGSFWYEDRNEDNYMWLVRLWMEP